MQRATFRLVTGAAVLALAGAGGVAVAQAATTTTAPPQLDCAPAITEFGEPVQCNATGVADGFSIAWPDGVIARAQSEALSTEHAPVAVGPVTVSLTSADGAVIASSQVVIEPDLALECATEDVLVPIHKLVEADTADGWDYVYLADDGTEIDPDHPDHPVDPGLTPLEPVVIGEAYETGVCSATSAAAEALDGDFAMTIRTAWHENTVPFNDVKPWSKHHWIGTQPGEVDVTVTVNDRTASERTNVYLSGCN